MRNLFRQKKPETDDAPSGALVLTFRYSSAAIEEGFAPVAIVVTTVVRTSDDQDDEGYFE